MKRYIICIALLLFYSNFGFGQTLDEYYKIAAENNPGLRAQYNKFEAAMQKVPQESTLADPTLSFGYFISPVETRVGPQQAKFSLTQMFPWFGTLKAQGNAAALQAKAKFQIFIDARNKLFYKVASAYYPLYELKHWIRVEQENISILKSYKIIANQKFKSATGSMVDVLRVDMMLQEAQTNLDVLTIKEKPLLTKFNKLLNRPGDESVVVSDTLKPQTLLDHYRKDSLIASNPRLKALELKTEASKAAEIAAQKQGLPKIGVGLDYVIVGKRSDMALTGNGKDVFMPMVSVSIPIYRKKYKGSIKEAQLMQDSYANQKREVTNTLVSEYEMAWFEVREQRKLVSLYEQQIKTTEQSLDLLFASYGNSGKQFEEVLRMQQQVLKYRKKRATALSRYKIAIAKINYLTSKTYYNENIR